MKRICVFCGANIGAQPKYAETARSLGTLLAERKIGLVYGGGTVGLMGALADAAQAAGGEVIGVIPKALVDKEARGSTIRDLRVVSSMHDRKALMANLADGFIAMPGGYGTLEELCEILTWSQLGIHRKRCGLLNVLKYFDDLLRLLDHAINGGAIIDHEAARERRFVADEK
jgi:uncharacterized protein (TIGR00730 family)